jgi:hypothetical protein
MPTGRSLVNTMGSVRVPFAMSCAPRVIKSIDPLRARTSVPASMVSLALRVTNTGPVST